MFHDRLLSAQAEEAYIRSLMSAKRRPWKLSAARRARAVGAQTPQQAMAQNAAIRQNILANAIPVLQNVRSGTVTYTPGSPTTWTVLASNVGLIRRFFLELTLTLNTTTGGKTLTATPFGLANLLSNVQFIDQNNRLRINTTGMHLHAEACQKRRRLFGNALGVGDIGATTSSMSDQTGFGINFPVNQLPPATAPAKVITAATPCTATFVWEIPVVQSNQDLTGAIYANQTTSNNQLQFTLNPNMFVASGDAYNACFVTTDTVANALVTNVKWTLYQDFLDQLPVDNNKFAQLPPIDIAYALCLQMINPGTIVQAQDNLYALPPFNLYQDLMLFWDNPAYNTAPVGSDVNYIKVQISNTYVLLQVDPVLAAIRARNLLGTDMPAFIGAATSGAIYDLDFRHKPLSVNQLSSTNIVFNPSTVESGGNLQYGLEYIWYANQAAA
jgi:hypothetical protein